NIDYNSEITSVEEITTKIEKLGYGVETEKTELDVIGMTCAACSSRIEKVLNKQPGDKQATVNLTTENATVEYNPGLMNVEDIKIGRAPSELQSRFDIVCRLLLVKKKLLSFLYFIFSFVFIISLLFV